METQQHSHSLSQAAFRSFLGVSTPEWYKAMVIMFLVLNPALLATGFSKFAVGWAIMAEFIVFLAGALKCYPLLPGGLLVMESLVLGMGTVEGLYEEAHHNFPVILLLVFVVAGVAFLKDLLMFVFSKILTGIKSKSLLGLAFCMSGAVLSANLDALTVISIVITVFLALYKTYNDYRSRTEDGDDAELAQFRSFLQSLSMQAAIGTMLGGVLTKVGEPQNLLIAHVMESALPVEFAEDWTFVGFMVHMAPVTVPTLFAGMVLSVLVEKLRVFGYGAEMPVAIRTLLETNAKEESSTRTVDETYKLAVQAVCAALLVTGLATHIAEVGILGLFLIVLTTVFNGVNDEHHIGQAFTFSLPFVALLVVFFGIVDVIGHNQLFQPVVEFALAQNAQGILLTFFAASGALSSISDNVFVATVFINEAKAAYDSGVITAHEFEKLAIAINAGTNILSIATPNGQAAFLFLLTSPLAAKIELGYGKMLYMALPFTVPLAIVSTTCVWLLL